MTETNAQPETNRVALGAMHSGEARVSPSCGARWLLTQARKTALCDVNFDRILLLLCLPLALLSVVALSEESFETALRLVANSARVFVALYSVVLGFLVIASRWRTARDLFFVILMLAISTRLAPAEERKPKNILFVPPPPNVS